MFIPALLAVHRVTGGRQARRASLADRLAALSDMFSGTALTPAACQARLIVPRDFYPRRRLKAGAAPPAAAGRGAAAAPPARAPVQPRALQRAGTDRPLGSASSTVATPSEARPDVHALLAEMLRRWDNNNYY